MLKLYYETAAIQVSYDQELQLGFGEWKGFVSSDEFRDTAMRSLDFVNEHGITRWLADRRHMKAIRQQDQQWIVEEFIPKLQQSPLHRMANVVSDDIFNKMAMENIFQRSGGLGSIVSRDFDTIDEALAWLKQPFDSAASAAADSSAILMEE
jgi:hypothetical protein